MHALFVLPCRMPDLTPCTVCLSLYSIFQLMKYPPSFPSGGADRLYSPWKSVPELALIWNLVSAGHVLEFRFPLGKKTSIPPRRASQYSIHRRSLCLIGFIKLGSCCCSLLAGIIQVTSSTSLSCVSSHKRFPYPLIAAN